MRCLSVVLLLAATSLASAAVGVIPLSHIDAQSDKASPQLASSSSGGNVEALSGPRDLAVQPQNPDTSTATTKTDTSSVSVSRDSSTSPVVGGTSAKVPSANVTESPTNETVDVSAVKTDILPDEETAVLIVMDEAQNSKEGHHEKKRTKKKHKNKPKKQKTDSEEIREFEKAFSAPSQVDTDDARKGESQTDYLNPSIHVDLKETARDVSSSSSTSPKETARDVSSPSSTSLDGEDTDAKQKQSETKSSATSDEVSRTALDEPTRSPRPDVENTGRELHPDRFQEEGADVLSLGVLRSDSDVGLESGHEGESERTAADTADIPPPSNTIQSNLGVSVPGVVQTPLVQTPLVQTPLVQHGAPGNPASESSSRAAELPSLGPSSDPGLSDGVLRTRWFDELPHWDTQRMLASVREGKPLPPQEYKGVRVIYKVNGYSGPAPVAPSQPAPEQAGPMPASYWQPQQPVYSYSYSYSVPPMALAFPPAPYSPFAYSGAAVNPDPSQPTPQYVFNQQPAAAPAGPYVVLGQQPAVRLIPAPDPSPANAAPVPSAFSSLPAVASSYSFLQAPAVSFKYQPSPVANEPPSILKGASLRPQASTLASTYSASGSQQAPASPYSASSSQQASALTRLYASSQQASAPASPYSASSSQQAPASPYSASSSQQAPASPYSSSSSQQASALTRLYASSQQASAPASPYSASSSQQAPASPYSSSSSQQAPALPYSLSSSQQAPASPYSSSSSQQAPASPYSSSSSQQAPASPYSSSSSQQAPASPYSSSSSQQVPASPYSASSSQQASALATLYASSQQASAQASPYSASSSQLLGQLPAPQQASRPTFAFSGMTSQPASASAASAYAASIGQQQGFASGSPALPVTRGLYQSGASPYTAPSNPGYKITVFHKSS